MFSASKTLSDNLTAVFAASLVVGLLIAVVAAWLSSSRLRHLMSEVRAAQPEQPIAFTPTGIVEVDELSEAIESMGEEVAMTASRLSRILRLSDRGIGAFEYSYETDAITFTDGFFATLSTLDLLILVLRSAAHCDGVVERERVREPYEMVRSLHRGGGRGRYLFTGPHRPRGSSRGGGSGEHNRVLGLVEDVTHENRDASPHRA